MKSASLFVACEGARRVYLEEEYAFLGLYTKRVPNGISIPAIQPNAKKNDDGSWGWTWKRKGDKSKSKPQVRKPRRDEDEDKPKTPRTKAQAPKTRRD